MKKILWLFFALTLSLNLSAFSADTNWTTETGLKKVNTIGKALLSKSNLPTQIEFKVMETDEVNAFANGDNEIYVYTGLLKFVDNDAELAGVIAHEIGHIVNHHVAKQSVIATITTNAIQNANINTNLKTGALVANNLSMLKMSRSEEYEADVTGVDLMTKAGYNPLAMVSVLYKISGNYIDFTSTHPSGDKRTMYSYNYITYNYPTQAKSNYSTDSYKLFLEYAQPIVDKRNANAKKLAKFNKDQEKLKKKRLAKLEKYKNDTSTNGWDKSLEIINTFSSSN